MDITDKRRAFGLFLSKHRIDAGLTQKQVAATAGISRPYLTQIEAGHRMPSDDTFMALLVAVGATMDEFLMTFLADQLSPDELSAAMTLTQPLTEMQKHLSPEQIIELMSAQASMESIGQSIAVLGGLPAIQGPDGWAELSAEDKRLVQRMVNRLRKDYEPEADDGDQ